MQHACGQRSGPEQLGNLAPKPKLGGICQRLAAPAVGPASIKYR
eukprot:CAMPEP_0198505006 /NCGR_PEP_ID=MMETSP1462-20131121/10787_1 /TAXON_ID=1333877 /ORGANISM="Brandtodinium nutriculum, Strain RCC3387" /LENGTH=43 /DNA_ID= /DNA_START= /DNA_END= /DNA_ORIENTATION=